MDRINENKEELLGEKNSQFFKNAKINDQKNIISKLWSKESVHDNLNYADLKGRNFHERQDNKHDLLILIILMKQVEQS